MFREERREGAIGLLWIASALAAPLASSLPMVPSHDLERLTLPVQPFIVIAATIGLVQTAQRISRSASGLKLFAADARSVLAVVLLLCTLPALYQAYRAHPYQLTYFNLLVGGVEGAERLGFDVAYSRTEVNDEVLEALNDLLPGNAKLYANFVYLEMRDWQLSGKLRKDITLVGHSESEGEYMILHARRSWMSPFEDDLYRQRPEPIWRLTHNGVDLVLLYEI